jgi:hypothetical protein
MKGYVKYTMKKLLSVLLLAAAVVCVACESATATTLVLTTPTKVPVKTWHVTHHFSSETDCFGTPCYMPDRDEQVTVTRPWRVAWQVHLDPTFGNDNPGFTLVVCQLNASIGIPECTTLVYNSTGAGITAPIQNPYNDVTLDMSLCCGQSTWALDVEEWY